MANHSNDIDQEILARPRAYRSEDPNETLTEGELDRVLEHFGKHVDTCDAQLRDSLQMQFQIFYAMAHDERCHKTSGRSGQNENGQVKKPSTIIKRDMKQLNSACEKLLAQFAKLDPMTRRWLDLHLKGLGEEDSENTRIRLRDLEAQFIRPVELLIHAAHGS